jgi:cytochrome c oxidase cbb3-type subunit 3
VIFPALGEENSQQPYHVLEPFVLLKLIIPLFLLHPFVFAQKASTAVNRGQQQFKQSCAFCHGATGDGGAEGPSLIRSAILRHDADGDLLGPVIRDGRPDKGMPALGLSPDKISDIIAFLHDQLKKLDRTSPDKPSNDHYSLQVLLVGDAAAGQAYFEGAGGCSSCHSPTADLAHIAQKFGPADLQTRMLYPTGKLPSVTVTPKSGEPVQGTLLQKDAFNVEIRDNQGWHHSWPLRSVKVVIKDPLAAHRTLLKTITNADVHNLFAYLETLH